MDSRQFFTGSRVVVILALVAGALWGSAYPAVKTGYAMLDIGQSDTASQLLFAGYRFFLAGAFLLLFAKMSGKSLIIRHHLDILRVFVLGLVMTAMQYTFFYIGMANTTGVKASILNATGTFVSVIVAHFVFKAEHLNLRTSLGCVIGFIGVMAVNLGKGGFEGAFTFLGDGFIILAAAVLAVGGIFGKIISQSVDSTVMTGWQLLAGGAILTGIGWFAGGGLGHVSPAPLALLLYMALLSSVAFAIMATLLKYNPVGRVTVFNFTIPVFGAALSAIFLGETILEFKYLVALVLVCVGIYIVNAPKKA